MKPVRYGLTRSGNPHSTARLRSGKKARGRTKKSTAPQREEEQRSRKGGERRDTNGQVARHGKSDRQKDAQLRRLNTRQQSAFVPSYPTPLETGK
ncbi:hypothetical protein TGDOM2_397700 [Toxoplasma gondii GAB2-2007-GAL-DOM2]|uniref:Uncharacterized protein n=1 Tax=Toxoplasma gondii GAB2-2007-GAL-DOM2 TaxID=1130820 RepID=A0A086KVV3_TOXGO|nr:hypothetical protein TGDOM2_397700 [Toxoplasma gondii GAB2-2007-GAL-DOM2]